MYCSADGIQIFQDDPLEWRPSTFKLKGWTDTVTGYLYEANKLSRCLWENRRLMDHDYSWEVTVNIEAILTPKQITETWTKVCRKFRKHGVVAFWVREPSLSNHCSYHLIIKNNISREELVAAIEDSMPSRAKLPYHKHIERIKSQWHYVRYITKAKTAGFVDGRQVQDKYQSKRLLFASKLGLCKQGRIGDFWEKPPSEIWQGICDKEARIAKGLEQNGIRDLVNHVHSWMPGVSERMIERQLGYHAESEAVKRWAAELEKDPWSTADNGELLTRNEPKVSESSGSGQQPKESESTQTRPDTGHLPFSGFATVIHWLWNIFVGGLLGQRSGKFDEDPAPVWLHPP
jgi:hypothetical protein